MLLPVWARPPCVIRETPPTMAADELKSPTSEGSPMTWKAVAQHSLPQSKMSRLLTAPPWALPMIAAHLGPWTAFSDSFGREKRSHDTGPSSEDNGAPRNYPKRCPPAGSAAVATVGKH